MLPVTSTDECLLTHVAVSCRLASVLLGVSTTSPHRRAGCSSRLTLLRRGSLESFSFAGRDQFVEIRNAEVGYTGLYLMGSNGIMSYMSCRVSCCFDRPQRKSEP